MNWRVTHFDIHGQRRRLVVTASTRDIAVAWAEQLYGDAVQIRAIRLSGVPV